MEYRQEILLVIIYLNISQQPFYTGASVQPGVIILLYFTVGTKYIMLKYSFSSKTTSIWHKYAFYVKIKYISK